MSFTDYRGKISALTHTLVDIECVKALKRKETLQRWLTKRYVCVQALSKSKAKARVSSCESST